MMLRWWCRQWMSHPTPHMYRSLLVQACGVHGNLDRSLEERMIRELMALSTVETMSYCPTWTRALSQTFFLDKTHPASTKIYAMVEEIEARLIECGHRPTTAAMLFDAEEEDEAETLSYRSVRLAIAFTLIIMNLRLRVYVQPLSGDRDACLLGVWKRHHHEGPTQFHHFRNEGVVFGVPAGISGKCPIACVVLH
ncbi:hypothetical protein BS78_08G010400 [Paspalum vaginatum]|nr:hypothetical protein BS78_08G010400 [Paspalum vaginatum]